jgi:hypothetical protein
MARVLRNLRIDDVSSVDVGAGRGVKVVLTKRAPLQLYNEPREFDLGIVADAVEEYLKREFSDKERQEAADSGAALPDGSYPIKTKEDLGNAIQAIGRAKNPAKAKAHIKARASALGATDMLPDSWSKRLTKAAVELVAERNVFAKVCKAAKDFNDMADAYEVADDASELMCCIRDAMCALDSSIQSILCDEDITDKAPSITTSFNQFKDHIGTLGLEDDADDDDTSKRDDDMTTPALSPQVQKMMDEAVAKAVAAATAASEEKINKLLDDLTVSKMSDAQKTYHDNLGSDAEKKKFRDMSPDQRDGEMDKTKKRLSDDPVVKGLMSELEDLRKRLQASDDEKDLKIAKTDAKELGLTQVDAGEVLMKMRRGDKDAIKKYEGYVAELAKSKKAFEKSSRAFEELGHTGSPEGTGASAYDQLMAMAKELRKSDPSLSEAVAYDKVYNDAANFELRQKDSAERMAKIHGRSAA